MEVPPASHLIDDTFLRRPRSARGLYLDRRPGYDDVHMRFVWAQPDRWLWMHKAEPPAGAITDGTTNVIVEDGVAVVVTDEGEVNITHRLTNLFQPSGYDYSSWEFGPVSAGVAIGRRAWITSATPSVPGKDAHDIVFDVESGVLLFMRTEESYLGFEELELDEDITDETFRWSGSIEPQKVGSALVIPDEHGTYSAIWEISVRGRPMFHQDGPARMTQDEAVGWCEARAARIQIRSQ